MDNILLPKTIDNHYHGQKLAFWFFWAVIIVRGVQGAFLIVNGSSIVRGADGVPLEIFPLTAAKSIVAVFVITGSSRFILSLLGILIFLRYRSMVPLMFVLLTLDQMAKEVLLHFYPLYRVGHPIGPIVNLVLLFLTIIGFILSITGTKSKTVSMHL